MAFVPFKQRFLARVAFALILLTLSGIAPALAEDDEPVAFIGHGGFFDRKGQQIPLTAEFVARAQDWYRAKLLSGLTAAKRAEFEVFEKRLNEGLTVAGQAQLVVRHRALDWLAANVTPSKENAGMVAKLNALKYELNWQLPDRPHPEGLPKAEEFKVSPELQNRLKLPIAASGNVVVQSATTNAGQAYLNECIGAGVPIPPPIGQLDPNGVTGWKSQGFIQSGDQFIVNTPAEVRTFKSASPPGMCFALPRYTDATLSTVKLDGVICLGQTTSKVCIWDNQMPGSSGGVGFSFPTGEVIPIGVPDLSINPSGKFQAGGFDLNNGSGGICTTCHAGENPYIIHPNADLGGGVLMGSLRGAPQHLPTFANDRYDPLVPPAWPQNALSMSPTLVPGACVTCHQTGGSGGRFPHLSKDLDDSTDPLNVSGYCATILPQAIVKTMPPFSPGSEQGTAAITAFLNWCGTPASAGPSTRGDPHLTTTNGINYDFQGAGEFVALRNSATGFELQTRQTPVTTNNTPIASSHTGLATCVSINTAIATRIGKHRVTYQPLPGEALTAERLQLRIDGKPATLPATGAISLGGRNQLAKSSAGGLDITVEDGTRVLVTPTFWSSQGLWYLNVEALNTPAREGTMGHIVTPDWLPLAPDGTSFGAMPVSLLDRYDLLNRQFADAWRVTNRITLFDYLPGTSTGTFTDRAWPPPPGERCVARLGTHRTAQGMPLERAQRLCEAVKDKPVRENCILDLQATGEAGFVKAYQQTLKLRENAVATKP